MIEEIGVVSEIKQKSDEQIILVETQIKSTCGSCEAQSNCGTGSIAKAFVRKKELLRFKVNETVSLGQKVKIGIPEESILKASLLVYLIPLSVLLLSAVLMQSLLPILGFQAEAWTIIFTFLCTFISFKLVKKHIKNNENDVFYPQFISVLPLDQEKIDVKQL
ncbi:SoxR reducing system RseC family protein [uncultured Paraglaciecola sp.]|uniref:SoxR reducing system RseC family protein n=1 Tax=uncultured Paraglaciecola sp. TaxID=1765024 RepID=UPI002599CB37|nr:SoxR reducing system RseC family protein [uncultured Paraglaciecola sp.]